MGGGPTFHFTSQGGGEMPQVGLGTATMDGERCVNAVVHALRSGYRLLDTALLYGNQVAVGEGIRKSGVNRKEIWVTSKVAFFPADSEGVWMHKLPNEKGADAVKESIDLCLKQLQLKQVDLMLIHNPASSVAEYNAACLPHFFELIGTYPPALREIIMGFYRTLSWLSGGTPTPEGPGRAQREAAWKALEAAQALGKCRYM